jgi:hypothetical protein
LEPYMGTMKVLSSRYATSIGKLLSHMEDDDHGIVFLPKLTLDPALWQLSCQHPHLLAAILAVSACHLGHFALDASAHRVAEYALASTAVRLFRSALLQPPGSRSGWDALLLTSMMLNTLSFAAVEDGSDVSASWVFSDDENRLSWLEIQLGLKPLLLLSRGFRDGSILTPVFCASSLDGSECSSENDANGGTNAESSREGLAELVVGEEGAGGAQNLSDGVKVLATAERFPPSKENFFRYVQFIGELDSEFVGRLCCRDEWALWIFGYWLGLVGRIPGMWWACKRVRRDRAAIWDYLVDNAGVCGRGGREGALWRRRMEGYRELEGARALALSDLSSLSPRFNSHGT